MTGVAARRVFAVLALAMLAAACSETEFLVHTAKRINDANESAIVYKVGKPYQIAGTWYYPHVDYEYDETGIASWYGPNFHGKSTANGEIYDMNALTAAHRTLPLPSLIEVTNLENGRKIKLRVNDRGPFAKGRILDVSRRGAQLLGFEQQGTARVRVRILAEESRQVAARLGAGATTIAETGSPITVGGGLPKAGVSTQALAEPGAPAPTAAPPPEPVTTGYEVAEVTPTVPVRSDAEPTFVPLREGAEPIVETVPVDKTSIYVQAGAFGEYANANRAHAVLSGVGDVRITSVLVNGRDLFRVRVGPVASVERADSLLEAVIGAGYPDARIIVD